MKRVIALIATAALTGCSLAPRYERPAAPVPASWPVGDAYLRQSEASLPALGYRELFRDPRLQTIIAQALANNRNLRVAAANIAAARAQYRIQRADLFPQVSVGGRANFGDSGTGTTNTVVNPGTGTGTGNGAGTGTGTGAGTGVVTTTTGGGFRDNYSVDLGFSAFELDLFGRIRSLTDSALARYFATEAAARTTRLTLVADIATAWLNHAADRSLLTVAQNTVTSAGQSVRLTRLRLEGGISPRTELRQAELVLSQAQSDLAAQTTAVAQDVNALQLLVGAPIDPALLPQSIDEAASTFTELPAGLDSGVLLRRPDVVQAEYLLRAANAEIGAARAAMFPRISLTALVGFASGSLTGLFDGGGFNWSAAPGVSLPIFNAGAVRAGVEQTEAQRAAALAQYELAIQTAFREVADALARRGTIDAQEAAQRQLVAASTDNYRLSDARYRGGIDTFLQSLDAQRSLYQAQRSLVATRLARGINLVQLYRTLGGDNQLEATADGPREVVPTP